ncbi:tetratricopeptide [Drepanopeziza brunnea f. sp. 'multigermtubi' MB_m1]|uniref:Tetratricopeptide n=1 Tax=Marssonina brunnea f. sp. multigermtubi (strain MB_m1) TaxID=1072389 RepID=K1X187_MARBU|nr:tetratricopeptide [Drepanopeziza brunnea f. sp. 'multigermtubi' MB_m1]EKD18777.1 tetratricopeptide [Drepanopeziza brunnea f. sp. 'multigermtubi' MB_m1]
MSKSKGAKESLKAIVASVKAQKYDDAVQEAQNLLASDPKNYQASIFLGFCYSKQNKLAEAETAYDAATKIKDSDPQAWQGLIQLYEKGSNQKLPAYFTAALRLAQIYEAADDKYKCQSVVDAFLLFAKSQGTRLQYKKAQEIVLPTSPIYSYLEGRIPHPAHTYQIIAQITEFEEKERINTQIGERRTRLGAKIGQVTAEVKREVLKDSDLEDIYEQIIDWSNEDEIRRQYEEKLIQRCVEALTVLPPGQDKIEKRNKAIKLATDMVIIKHPYKLAWDIAIEWKDAENIRDLDVTVLREYYAFFPTAGLAQVLRGFLSSEISPFPPPPPLAHKFEMAGSDESEDDDDDSGGVSLDGPMPAEDRLLLMSDGMADAGKSILAHRLMGEYYQFLEEYETVADLMRNGRRLVEEESSKTALKFEHSSDAMTALLGTALVYYQSPKNHLEAKTLFDGLLERKPTSTPALIGVGLIYEEKEDYPAAIDFLGRALQRDPKNIRVKTEAAWVKALNGDFDRGRDELEDCLAQINSKDLRNKDLVAQTQYRIGICIWNIDTSKAARKDRNGAYAYFLAALKSNLNYAPAYTSLGIFYADYLNDKKRSRKCFQKAFELSASEVEAAERLARIFAEQGEWELVEVVAQRVVDSGKVRPSPGSKKKGISWPFAALGVAELNKQDYARSIVSFQSALRITPNDYHSWVGLGESYHNSGRYIAATKAFQHAENFEHEVTQQNSGQTWFAKHMLANVKRELGDYDDAIEGYKAVLTDRPAEFGVSIALIQALVESAWDGIDKGLFGYAAGRAAETIDAALALASSRSDAFNLWRAVGDACSVFSWNQSRMSDFPHAKMKELLKTGHAKDAYGIFADVDGVGIDVVFADGLYAKDEVEGLNLTRCLHASVLAHKRAVHASAQDIHAQAVAYYNLGWAEHRTHVCLCAGIKKRSTRYLKAAVLCFKRAIELEAGNSEFWNALGVVTSELNPRVAQHSFIRSLFLNERSSQAWTNLGTLYLLQNDYELANEAFTRAQSTDPDFAHAWIGQGLLALLLSGDIQEANLLFTHAMEISESSSLITKKQYSQSTFDQLFLSKSSSSITDFVQPLFALKQLQSMDPNDVMYQHLSTLFLERIGDLDLALEALSKICATVEADYEVTESVASLSRFALAKADLARSQLAAGLYEEAIENGDTALQLSDEDAGNELTAESRQRCRLSAHLTVGLAQYYSEDPEAALQYFLPALEESNGNPDAVCLLAQVLWAKGDDDSRESARDHLYTCVDTHPEHVQCVLLLALIALLDNNALQDVTVRLQDLRTTHTTTDLEQSQVSELLSATAALSQKDTEKEVLTEIQTDILLHPGQPYGWNRLAEVEGDEHTADVALMTATKGVPPKGALNAEDLAYTFAGTGKVGDAQRAIVVAPWSAEGWDKLGAAAAGRG